MTMERIVKPIKSSITAAIRIVLPAAVARYLMSIRERRLTPILVADMARPINNGPLIEED